jgi:hypothetical protein
LPQYDRAVRRVGNRSPFRVTLMSTLIRRRIALAVSATWLGQAVRIGLNLAGLPIIFRFLGQEELGIWLILGQSSVVLSMLVDAGLTPTLTRRIAFAAGKTRAGAGHPLDEESRHELANLVKSAARIAAELLKFAWRTSPRTVVIPPIGHLCRRGDAPERYLPFAQAGGQLLFHLISRPRYLPFAQAGGQLLFHLISRLYERTSVSSPPTWPSPSGQACLASRGPHDASLFERIVCRTCVLNSAICVFERSICQGIPLAIWWPNNRTF